MNSQRLAYLCDRIQKITDAIYRVTDLLLDKEPMKWELREKAVSVFTKTVSLKDKSFLEKNNDIDRIESSINQLVALLSLFAENRAISGVNFEILKDEYSSVKRIVSKEKQKQDFIKLSLPESPKESAKQKTVDSSIRQANGHNLSDRKDRILNVIKNKKEVSIGDLSTVLTECSEKTIQRDLLEMVEKGILKKEGDKRWRKYSLTT